MDRILLQIHATDRDEGDNARISYSIDDPTLTFRINEVTGELYLIKPLDYEKIRSYSIAITGWFKFKLFDVVLQTFCVLLARDHGIPQLNNYAQVIIDVTDVNDNAPDILLTQINGTKHESQPIDLSECSPKGRNLIDCNHLHNGFQCDVLFFLQERRCFMFM